MDTLAVPDFRMKTKGLELKMEQMPQVDIPPVHYFADGLYVREVFIPAGTLVIGKIHKYEHVNIISKGRATVATEQGLIVITAPHTMISPAGTKKAVFTHEDTVWTTIHATNETDLDKLEEELIVEDYLDEVPPDSVDELIVSKEI